MDDDESPRITRTIDEITEEDIHRINEEQWPYVNGMFDSKGQWRDWNELTVGLSYEDNELIILPYTACEISS